MMKVFLFSLFISNCCFSQMPETDIWVVDLIKKEGKYCFEKPLNFTNRRGYDNQPSFSSDGKEIYFVSNKDSNQTDVFVYNLKINLVELEHYKKFNIILSNVQIFECIV